MKQKLLVILMLLFGVVCLRAENTPDSKDNTPIAAYRSKGLWHFIDKNGKDIFAPAPFLGVGALSEGLIAVRLTNDTIAPYAYINTQGKVVIRPKTKIPFPFSNGFAKTTLFLDSTGVERLYGLIDKSGKEILPRELRDFEEFSNGLAYIMNDTVRGYYDTDFKLKINLGKTVGYKFSEGLAGVMNTERKFGFIDTTGKQVIPFKFDEIGTFSEGLCKINSTNKFGYIDKNGNLRISCQYDDARDFHNKRAFIAHFDENFNPTWGIINDNGKGIEDFIFRFYEDYSEDVAAVFQDSLWHYIDLEAKPILPVAYVQAGSFVDGIAYTYHYADRKAGYINKKGEYLFTIEDFDMLVDFRTGKRYKKPNY